MTLKHALADLVTDDGTVSILTHLAAAAFGVWAGIVKMGQWINVNGICETAATRPGCRRIVQVQADWQLALTGAGLALVIVAAVITVYNQRGDADADA